MLHHWWSLKAPHMTGLTPIKCPELSCLEDINKSSEAEDFCGGLLRCHLALDLFSSFRGSEWPSNKYHGESLPVLNR